MSTWSRARASPAGGQTASRRAARRAAPRAAGTTTGRSGRSSPKRASKASRDRPRSAETYSIARRRAALAHPGHRALGGVHDLVDRDVEAQVVCGRATTPSSNASRFGTTNTRRRLVVGRQRQVVATERVLREVADHRPGLHAEQQRSEHRSIRRAARHRARRCRTATLRTGASSVDSRSSSVPASAPPSVVGERFEHGPQRVEVERRPLACVRWRGAAPRASRRARSRRRRGVCAARASSSSSSRAAGVDRRLARRPRVATQPAIWRAISQFTGPRTAASASTCARSMLGESRAAGRSVRERRPSAARFVVVGPSDRH